MAWRRPWSPSSVQSAQPLRHRSSHFLWRTMSWVGISRMSCSWASCASVYALPHSCRGTRGNAAIASSTVERCTVYLRDSSNPFISFSFGKLCTIIKYHLQYYICFTFTLIYVPHVVDSLCMVSWSPACSGRVDIYEILDIMIDESG